MTRLALGLKCGAFGVRGLEPLGAEAPSALSSCNRDASATEPRPTPHCRKNQRRVMSLAYSERSSLWRFMARFRPSGGNLSDRERFQLLVSFQRHKRSFGNHTISICRRSTRLSIPCPIRGSGGSDKASAQVGV